MYSRISNAMLTDQGTQFMSNVFKRALQNVEDRQVSHNRLSFQNRMVVQNGVTGDYLRCFVNHKKDTSKWDEWIPFEIVCIQHNSTFHN